MIIITNNVQKILQWYKDTYVDFKTPQEYGRSAFWLWYDQICIEIRELERKRIPFGNNRNIPMQYWGNIVYSKETVSGEVIIKIEDFIFDNKKFKDWLFHIVRNKIPYSIYDTCFGFSSVLYDNSQKYGILKPDGKPLIKPIFDDIINFHHSTDDYNNIHAIGFIGDRVYSINMDGNITLLHISKEQYLNKKHRYNEMTEKLNQIIENVLDKHLKSQRLNESSINKRRKMSRTELKNIINQCVNTFINENNSYQNLKFEYAKYLAAADRLTKENKIDLAMKSLEKAYSILSQINQHQEFDGTDYTSRENCQNDETMKNGFKVGRGSEMFGRGGEFNSR